MDFQKNFIIVVLQDISEPIITYNPINDFINFIKPKFHVLMFSCLRVSMGERKKKIYCGLIFGNQCVSFSRP